MLITLCMIVKNESKIITRCLESMRYVIDYVAIVDTGSTDNTKQIISDWCHYNGFPYKLTTQPFVNFGVSRTESYRFAEASFPETDYFLLCDADMVLNVVPGFNKETDLVGDSIRLTQKNKFIEYDNVRLIKNIPGWKSIGVTHEYTHNNLAEKLTHSHTPMLYFTDEEDGGSKTDKFTRDIKLLTTEINSIIASDSDHPDRYLLSRYYFYLAQSHRDLADTNPHLEKDARLTEYIRSIFFYKKCVEHSTWDEEKYIACLTIGDLYAKCQERFRPGDIMNAYLEAHNQRSDRYEVFYRLVKYFNDRQQFNTALLFTKNDAADYKTQDVLFNNLNECRFNLPIEKTVALARLGKTDEFLSEVEKLEKKWQNELKNLKNDENLRQKIESSLQILRRNKEIVLQK